MSGFAVSLASGGAISLQGRESKRAIGEAGTREWTRGDIIGCEIDSIDKDFYTVRYINLSTVSFLPSLFLSIPLSLFLSFSLSLSPFL
jgi:hypothetical protein